MLALTYASAKNIAIFVVVGLVLVSLLMAKVIAGASRKALTLLIFACLAFAVWSQRQSLQTCADDVQEVQDGRDATCSFFGQEITIQSPVTR